MEQSTFLLLSWPLDELGYSVWPDSFCSLVSRITSLARAYLLVMANIYSDVLGFFMVSLWMKHESLSPFLKNIIFDLPSTSGMRFLLLQKCWVSSRSNSPFIWTMPAKSHSTPGCAHVAHQLLLNSQHKWVQERTDTEGSPRSHILSDEDWQTGK
jgi:hypothetical protein